MTILHISHIILMCLLVSEPRCPGAWERPSSPSGATTCTPWCTTQTSPTTAPCQSTRTSRPASPTRWTTRYNRECFSFTHSLSRFSTTAWSPLAPPSPTPASGSCRLSCGMTSRWGVCSGSGMLCWSSPGRSLQHGRRVQQPCRCGGGVPYDHAELPEALQHQQGALRSLLPPCLVNITLHIIQSSSVHHLLLTYHTYNIHE